MIVSGIGTLFKDAFSWMFCLWECIKKTSKHMHISQCTPNSTKNLNIPLHPSFKQFSTSWSAFWPVHFSTLCRAERSGNALNVPFPCKFKELRAVRSALRPACVMQRSTSWNVAFQGIVMRWRAIISTTVQHSMERWDCCIACRGVAVGKGVYYGKILRPTWLQSARANGSENLFCSSAMRKSGWHNILSF